MRVSKFSLAILFASVMLGAQSDPAKRGQKLFPQTCGFCHGPDATGGAEGPNLMRSALVRHDDDGNLISTVIREGRPAKGMPPIPLTGTQIADVVAFLHWKLADNDRRSPGNPRDTDLKLLLTGNAGAGKTYFEAHCASCHSPAGDLKAIASKLAPADLQAQFLYPSGATKTVTVTTAAGVRFTGKLFYQDQFTVSLTDADGWYHSWPASKVNVAVHDPLAAHAALIPGYSEADVHNVFAFLETLR